MNKWMCTLHSPCIFRNFSCLSAKLFIATLPPTNRTSRHIRLLLEQSRFLPFTWYFEVTIGSLFSYTTRISPESPFLITRESYDEEKHAHWSFYENAEHFLCRQYTLEIPRIRMDAFRERDSRYSTCNGRGSTVLLFTRHFYFPRKKPFLVYKPGALIDRTSRVRSRNDKEDS